MAELFANNVDPDQMPHSAASGLGLHCLPITLLQVSRLQWVKERSWLHYDETTTLYFIMCAWLHTQMAKFAVQILTKLTS